MWGLVNRTNFTINIRIRTLFIFSSVYVSTEFISVSQLKAEAKKNKTEEEKPPVQSSITPAERGPKPCRYGNLCTRKDCRFGHEKDKILEY